MNCLRGEWKVRSDEYKRLKNKILAKSSKYRQPRGMLKKMIMKL